MLTLLAQIDYKNKKVYILEEILGKAEDKGKNTPGLTRKIQKKLYKEKHIGGVDVAGDPQDYNAPQLRTTGLTISQLSLISSERVF